MKRFLLCVSLLCAFSFGQAQNLIQHGDFTGVTPVAADGYLYRIASLTDLGKDVQAANPTVDPLVKVTSGTWYKKAGNTGALKAQILSNIAYGAGNVSAVNMTKTGAAAASADQNQLIQYLSVTEGHEYKLEFDIRTADGLNNYEEIYVQMRAITGATTIAFMNANNLSMTESPEFHNLGNGWFRFSKTFTVSSPSIQTADYQQSMLTIAKAVNNETYSYYITNVSLTDTKPTALDQNEFNNAKVVANANMLRIYNFDGQVSVYNIAGKLVSKVDCKQDATLNIAEQGVFIVRLQKDGATKTLKVVL